MNIVAVDNNPADLSQLADAITKCFSDSQIESFTDPLLAAKYICNNPVDMVFLVDAMRPANGFKLMRVLRANVPKLPIVMLSDGEANRADAIRAGFAEYFVKPVSPEQLGGVMNQLAV